MKMTADPIYYIYLKSLATTSAYCGHFLSLLDNVPLIFLPFFLGLFRNVNVFSLSLCVTSPRANTMSASVPRQW
jgi:hypothetical protein